MEKYIWMLEDFPHFVIESDKILPLLTEIKYRQGVLTGKQAFAAGPKVSPDALATLTEEIVCSSAIEGIRLDMQQVRSSVARRLGMEGLSDVPVDRDIDGIVAVMMDAVQHYDLPLTHERLCSWHAAMFPGGYSGLVKINTGRYRDDALGAMQVVSGPLGRERVHYQAPPAAVVPAMMQELINYVNQDGLDGVIKAAVVHLWFVIIHPFDDGNGRIARALSEMMICRSEGSSKHLYSLSSVIKSVRSGYYDALKITEGESLNITSWVEWFLQAMSRALETVERGLTRVAAQQAFWKKYGNVDFNARQRKVLEKLMDGFEGKLTTAKWGKICACSQDTAGRDIAMLMAKGILVKHGEGRATEYRLAAEACCEGVNF